MMYTLQQICEAVKASLTDELRQAKYRDKPLPAGCCYVASEAIYHLNLQVGPKHRLAVCQMNWEDVSHWYLFDRDAPMGVDNLIDVTSEQFENEPRYTTKQRSFLTKYPSNRAVIVMQRAISKLTTNLALTSDR